MEHYINMSVYIHVYKSSGISLFALTLRERETFYCCSHLFCTSYNVYTPTYIYNIPGSQQGVKNPLKRYPLINLHPQSQTPSWIPLYPNRTSKHIPNSPRAIPRTWDKVTCKLSAFLTLEKPRRSEKELKTDIREREIDPCGHWKCACPLSI